jgi:hypothetical protein
MDDDVDGRIQVLEARIVATISPVPADDWHRLAAEDLHAMADQSPEWSSALGQGAWRDASRLYRFADGRTVVLPLLASNAAWRGRGWAASMPASRGFGGLVGRWANDLDVISAVLNDLASQRWLSIRIRPSPVTGDSWARAAPPQARVIARRAHVLDLTPGPEALFYGMRKSARRYVRRYERGGLEVEVGQGGELLDVYQELRQHSIRQWAAAQHEPLWLATRRAAMRDPPERLDSCARGLGARFRVWVARVDGRAVAANVVVSGSTAHAIRAASLRGSDVPPGAMQYLDWLAIERASQQGSVAMNLGESGTSPSLSAYKEGFGAVAHDYSEVRLERLPITTLDRCSRSLVKRIVRFQD